MKNCYACLPSNPVSSIDLSIMDSSYLLHQPLFHCQIFLMTDGSSNIVHVSLASLKSVHSMDKYDYRFLSSLTISGMKLVNLNGS